MTDLRFGFVVGTDLTLATSLEASGVDSLWVGGHVASPRPNPEAMVSLARLSAVTNRAVVGTAVLLLPLYSPAIVAKQLVDIDRATNGRVIAGVGVGGEYPMEFRACQVPVEERGPRTDEAIELIRRLWTAEPVTHEGPTYPMADVTIQPAPVRVPGVPIVVAGRKEPAMRRAARLGDGWMPYMYSPHRYAESVQAIHQLASSHGRSLDQFDWYLYAFVNVDVDSERARTTVAQVVGGAYRRDLGKFIDHVAVAGNPAEVTAKLLDFVRAGARHLILMPAVQSNSGRDATVDWLVDDILPTVRSSAEEGPGSIDA